MKFPFLDDNFSPRSPNVSLSTTVNLYSELNPPNSKNSITLYPRPGLNLETTLPGISRGFYVFNNLQYHVIGNQIYTYDGTTVVNISDLYNFPNLDSSEGRVQFTDNGLTPTGGNQILFTDSTNAYVLNVVTNVYTTVNGDGSGAIITPTVVNGVITSLEIIEKGFDYSSATLSIIGGNPTSDATATLVLSDAKILDINIIKTGSGYFYPPTVTISAPGGGGTTAAAIITQSQILDTAIAGVTITNPGSGYTPDNPPTITVSAPTSADGVTAVLSAVLDGQTISSISGLVGGTGYGTPSLIKLLKEGGIGASAEATMSRGSLDTVSLTLDPYVGYSSQPFINIIGGGGTGALVSASVYPPKEKATATCTVTGGVIQNTIALTNNGEDYNIPPIISFYDSGNTDAGTGAVGVPILSGIVKSATRVSGGLYFKFEAGGYVLPTISFVGECTRPATGHVIWGAKNEQGNVSAESIVIDDQGAGYTKNPQIIFSIPPKGSVKSTSPISARQHGTVPADPAYFYTNLGYTLTSIDVTNGGTGYTANTNVMIESRISSIDVSQGGDGYTSEPTIDISGVISRIKITNGGSSLSSTPNIKITGGRSTEGRDATATATISGGILVKVTITDTGSGYDGTSTINVSFTPPSTITTTTYVSKATTTSTLTQSINYITMIDGGDGHYNNPPIITISDGTNGGTGATAISYVNNGLVTSCDVIESGEKYVNPVITFGKGDGFSPNTGQCGSVTFINGLGVISAGSTSSQWQSSGLSDFTQWYSLDQGNKFISSDQLMKVYNNNGWLWLLGKTTSEVWQNTGAGNPPFSWSASFDFGIASQNTLCKGNNTLYWLATQNNNSYGELFGIVMSTGSGASLISTSDINYEIQQMSRIDDSFAYFYTDSGHSFYVITFPTGDRTYVYDVNTEKWHRRSRYMGDLYTYGRELVDNYGYYKNKHYVTDYSNGNVYTFSTLKYTDNGSPIPKLRVGSPIFDIQSMNLVRHNKLVFDVQLGTGGINTIASATCIIASGIVQEPITITYSGSGYSVAPNIIFAGGGGQGATGFSTIDSNGYVNAIYLTNPGSGYLTNPTIIISGGSNNPQAILSFTDDNGYTWSEGYNLELGSIGTTLQQMVIYSLGMSRNRTYRLGTVDPILFVITNAFIEAEKGTR